MKKMIFAWKGTAKEWKEAPGIIISHYYGEDIGVTLVEEKPPKIAEKIKEFAIGSLYRMNAQSADCYTFTFSGGSWVGGWDWTNHLVDMKARHAFILSTGKFYKITKTL